MRLVVIIRDLRNPEVGTCVQVQRHLQLRIEAQGKYMQTILEKACQTLAGENMASAAAGSYNKGGTGSTSINGGNQAGGVLDIKEFGPPLNFPSFQNLNIYGSGEQLELQQSMVVDRPSLDGFMPNNNDSQLYHLGKKRPTPPGTYGGGSGKSPAAAASLMWPEHHHHDLRLQELGSAAAAATCLGSQDNHQIQMNAPGPGGGLSLDRSNVDVVIDSVSDNTSNIYETKPLISSSSSRSDALMVLVGDQKSTPSKLERPSPRRASTAVAASATTTTLTSIPSGDRININTAAGATSQGRNSPFG